MKRLVSVLAMAFLFVGCASLGPKLDAQKAKSIKKVAVIGYEINQQQPTDNLGLTSFKDATKNGGVQNTPEYQAMAKNIYQNLVSQIQGKTGWNVATFEQITAKKTYSDLVKSKMEGMRGTSLTGQNAQIIPLNGLLDVYAFRKLSPEQKTALAKDLGVDAIAEFTLVQSIDQPFMSVGHLMGTASFEYNSRSNLIVYTPGSEEPVWQIQNVGGTKVSSKDLPEGTSRLEKVAKVGFGSAQSSISNLVNTYNVQ